jgi:Cys-tRNA(Pro)/Cys-tRNA(Cys) deacylase
MFSSVNVHNHLQGLDIPHEIFKIPERAVSIEQAAAAFGVEAHQLARVEVYRIDGEPAIVIIPSDRKVDIEKLKKAAGAADVERVPPDEVASLTGYVSAAIPPVGLKTEMPAYIDYYTLREDVVYTGCGEPTAILKVRSYDLVRATGGETVDVVTNELQAES